MARMLPRATSVVITGASAGLGAALAKAYSSPGVQLGLVGRSEHRLQTVADQCRSAGASVEILVTDVTNFVRLSTWMADLDRQRPIDLVIANAGVFDGHGPDGQMETIHSIEAQIRSNLNGLMATVNAALPAMRQRRSGTLALVGSLAALQPLADAPAYSASKAGAMAYGEALREYLIDDGVRVALIYPGHIDTAQVRDHVGALPLMLSAEAAAAKIKRGLDRGRSFIAFPWPLLWLIRLGRMVPWQLRARLGKDFRFHVRKPPPGA